MSTNSTELNISVTFRHTESTEAIKAYAIEKVSHSLNKYLSGHVEVHVILSVEKRDHQAEVKAKSREIDVTASAKTEDLYSAIDKVIDTLETQIRKQKEIQRSQRHQNHREVLA